MSTARKNKGSALLWGPPGRPRRGPKPALSVERIVEAAIGLADEGGLEAVSMERLAQRFGFTTMSLYRYVPGKPELLELMIDAGIGPGPVLHGAAADWRGRLESWARQLWAGLHRRPWILEATGKLRVMGPNELSWLEAGMGALSSTGLSVRERQGACLAVLAQVRGMAQFSVGRRGGPKELTSAQWEVVTRRLLVEREAEFPQVAELVSAAGRAQGLDALRFGLACILDGLGLLIAGKEAQAIISLRE